MDELILAALQGQIEPDAAIRLDAWRRASPHNEAHFQAMARIWDMAAHADPLSPVGTPVPSLGELSTRRRRSAPDAPAAAGAAGTAGGRGWQRWVVVAMAAAAMLFILVRPSHLPVDDDGFSASEFVTEKAEMVTASLDDGSVVRLAPESRLRVAPVARRREVWLDGEAFFAVARDTARPFAVRTRAGSVEVLGTRFDLQVIGNELRLIVTEGKVALVSGSHRRVVVAGQIARVRDGGAPEVEGVAEVDSLLAWTGGFIAFQNTPLHQVARELERRYSVRVLLPDSTIASRTVTAWFTNQDFEHVLFAICRAVDAHCTLRDGVASIEP